MNINHILTCIDMSPAARRLVEVSALMAERLGAKVTLFHVEPRPPAGVGETAGWKAFAESYAEARERAASELTDTLDARGVSYDLASVAGTPRRAILDAIQARDVDLLILGSGGQGDATFGSTVSRVLRLADVPVMVVPSRGEPGEMAWTFNRILAPTDFQETSDAGLRAVRDLARRVSAGVSVATVVQWPRRTGLLAVQDGAAELPREISTLVEQAKTALVEQARGVGLTTALPHVVGGVRTSEALAGLAGELGADLIALPSLGKGAIARIMLGSTTERLVQISPVPVLVFPRAALERHGDL
ncbi:MAG: hypothetical protein CSA66_00155 [Proteobacteria bacterium]|nr:MAG: hypothetical protein CSA66_00155 [Pseudomonadota bacterium]